MDPDGFRATFQPATIEDGLERAAGETPLADGTWYATETAGEAIVYDLPAGALADAAFLSMDFLLDGRYSEFFRFSLHESGGDRTFVLRYGVLPQCAGRVRLPLSALDQGQWSLDREGAWCKPMVGGDRVDPAAVDRVELRPVWVVDPPTRWCQTPLVVHGGEPPRLADPALPEGPLLDEFGQSTIHEWDGRTESEAELRNRLREQRRRADREDPPAGRDEWGGWTGRAFEATGFFRTHHDGDRWWLVTPDGNPFWSAGIDCVTPNVHTRYDGLAEALSWLPDEEGEFADAYDHWGHEGAYVNYGVANLVRAFGAEEWEDAWADVALGQLRRFGFNTAGNWSNWEAAREAGVPYVRQLFLKFPDTPTVFRDMPDVYHEAFPEDAAAVASALEETVGDPAMVGYFLGNEPNWRFDDHRPAAGMLYTTEACTARRELADWLGDRYGDDGGLADAWEMDVSLDAVASGRWERELTDAALDDLDRFSSRMVARLYGTLDEACRAVDPDHLNLGPRLVDVPADWVLDGLDSVDVLTCNCYRPRVPDELGEAANTLDVPVLVGEWHFGALDVGLPAAALQRVPDQAARGDAYRVYLEHAAAQPWCVGAHYFTLYDQSALGRFDGENMNVGFLDVCHRPYEPLVAAARESHERLYDVATGAVDAYDDEPEYLTNR